MYFYHVLLFHGAIDQFPNLLEIQHDPTMDNIMFQKDLLKDWPTFHFLQCGWYFDYSKDNPPTLKIPLRENIESSFLETPASSTRRQAEGGRWKNISKGKGKLKEKGTKIPSFDVDQEAFVEVPFNQIVNL